MENSLINKWKDLLLDIGKRNNLINFHNTSSSLKIIYPDPDTVFQKITKGNTVELFATKKSQFIETTEEKNSDKKQQINTEIYNEDFFISTFANKLKAKQILPYNKTLDIIASIKNIQKKQKMSIEETGVNVVYIAFGFVRFEDGNTICHAPILLIPIEIHQASIISSYEITSLEDTIEINPAFNFKLKSEYKIELPEYKEQTLSQYLEQVQQLLQPLNFSIENEVKIGIFSFLKINMYHDLNDNEGLIVNNDVISHLINKTMIEKTKVDKKNEQTLHNVIDADSSQIEAIKMAKDNNSFVLQGPPGTGKSQTITNIIAELLLDGKKVLFVSEKLAALNIVYNKLTNVGLSNYCLELHSHKANKKNVIKDLANTLSTLVPIVNNVDNNTKFSETEKKLNGYKTEIHKKNDKIDLSLYELINLYLECNDQPNIKYSIYQIENKDIIFLQNVINQLEIYSQFTDTIGEDFTQNEWYGFETQNLTSEISNQIEEKMTQNISFWDNIEQLSNEINNTLGLTFNSLSEANTVLDFVTLLSKIQYFSNIAFAGKTPTHICFEKYNTFFDNINKLHTKIKKLLYTEKNNSKSTYISDICSDAWLFSHLINHKIDFEQIQTLSVFSQKAQTAFNINKIDSLANECSNSLKNIRNKCDEINKIIGWNIYNLDAQKLYDNLLPYKTKFFAKIFSPKYYSFISELNLCGMKMPLNLDQILNLLTEVIQIKKYIDEYTEQLTILYDELNRSFEIINYDDFLKEYQEIDKQFDNFDNFDYLSSQKENFLYKKNSIITELATTLQNNIEKYEQTQDFLAKFFNKTYFNIYNNDLNTHYRFKKCLEKINELQNWHNFTTILSTLKECECYNLVIQCIEKKISSKRLVNIYKTYFYRQWIEKIINGNKFIQNYFRAKHDQDIKEFIIKDEKNFNNNIKLIQNELNNQAIKSCTLNLNETAIIKREGEKQKKHKNIIELFTLAPNVVQAIKPCFLMSPLSVSTYLNPQKIHFDVVIFDEASQIFPQDAIGAIYRANKAIVVGDAKQMPPSNFFTSSIEIDDEDEDANEADSFESILDLCSGSMQMHSLKWHYRSHYEQLIAFSNKNFYKNELITFPSAKIDKQWIGVDYYHCDGIFNRTKRVNEIEAQFVVDLIFENIKKFPNRSLGVVAFSISQATLIEDLLEKQLDSHPEYIPFFNKSETTEPFFIKNLETVQGDERDTIIFSVAYGMGSDNKLLLNFGPINKSGGERRLNVAFSRAKENVQLVTSLHSSDIDLNRTQSKGIEMLKEYIQYAEIGYNNISKGNTKDNSSKINKFEKEVYEFIKSKGYEASLEVGCSKSSVDIGIKSNKSDEYLLAIECDGTFYKSQKNTRDCERLRKQVLKKMGWDYHRMWCVDWIKNNDQEKELLLKVIENVFNQSKK